MKTCWLEAPYVDSLERQTLQFQQVSETWCLDVGVGRSLGGCWSRKESISCQSELVAKLAIELLLSAHLPPKGSQSDKPCI